MRRRRFLVAALGTIALGLGTGASQANASTWTEQSVVNVTIGKWAGHAWPAFHNIQVRMKNIIATRSRHDARIARRVKRHPSQYPGKVHQAQRAKLRGRDLLQRTKGEGRKIARAIRRRLPNPPSPDKVRKAAIGCSINGLVAYGIAEHEGAGDKQAHFAGAASCLGSILIVWLGG